MGALILCKGVAAYSLHVVFVPKINNKSPQDEPVEVQFCKKEPMLIFLTWWL